MSYKEISKKVLLSVVIFLALVTGLLVGCDETSLGHMIMYGSVNGEFNSVQLDELTRGVVILDNIHNEIHEGHCFYSYDVTDLPNGANRTILLDTSGVVDEECHFYWEVDMELEASVDIWEDATVTDNGTAMPVHNRNRNSAGVNLTLIRHTPVIATLGTLIYETQLGSGRMAGGTDTSFDELVLRNGTRYLMIITNETANNNVVSGKMIWYEHN